MSDTKPLIGEVNTQFTTPIEQLAARYEDARLEQEAMCGYPVKLVSSRNHEVRDEKTGQLVIEVFATFAPVENS